MLKTTLNSEKKCMVGRIIYFIYALYYRILDRQSWVDRHDLSHVNGNMYTSVYKYSIRIMKHTITLLL